MSETIIHEYHGQKIEFQERTEEWGVVYDGVEQLHKSLQFVKNYIDRRNKKEFERVPVFVERGSFYDSKEGYEKAMITSVGVDGTIFIVREGRKSAEHCGTAYVQNEKNARLVGEIMMLHKAHDQAENRLRVAKDKLVEVNFEALKKKALGEQKDE